MADFETLKVTYEGFTAQVVLNRPETKNAMNFQMVGELTLLFHELRENRAIRAVVLSGAEGIFCSGGDIKEMRENAVPSVENAHNLDVMLRTVNEAPQVVIAKIEGVALGGGLGLVCVSDIAIASETASFGMPEVRLGIAPSFISPFVIQRLGFTRARELMLTGRRFNGKLALDYGLVHSVCPSAELDQCVAGQVAEIQQAAPSAIAAVKELLFTIFHEPDLDETVAYRASLLNGLRQGAEAQEGMLAFMQKRPPQWAKGD